MTIAELNIRLTALVLEGKGNLPVCVVDEQWGTYDITKANVIPSLEEDNPYYIHCSYKKEHLLIN